MTTPSFDAIDRKLTQLSSKVVRRMEEYLKMERALQRIADLDPSGVSCKSQCKCMGCIAREALPK